MKITVYIIASLFVINLISAQSLENQFPISPPNQLKVANNSLQFRLDSIYNRGEAYTPIGYERFYHIHRFQYDSLHRHIETLRVNFYQPSQLILFENFEYDNPVNVIHKYQGNVKNGIRDTLSYQYWKYDSLNRLEEYLLDVPYRHSLTTYSYSANKMLEAENFLTNGIWTPLFYKKHMYNVNGTLMSVLDSSYGGGQWRTTGNTDYYYTGLRLDSSAVFLRNNQNMPTAYSKTTYFHDVLGNIVADSLSHVYSAWSIISANNYFYDAAFSDTVVAAYFQYQFPLKIDSLKSWRKDGITWLPSDSNAYYYSPISTVGFEEELLAAFKLYPNPATEQLYIELQDVSAIKEIFIYNTLGQVVFSLNQPDEKQFINISHYSNGTYFFVAEYTSKNFSVLKFVKTSP